MQEEQRERNELAQLFVDQDAFTGKFMVSVGGYISRPTTIREVIKMCSQRTTISTSTSP